MEPLSIILPIIVTLATAGYVVKSVKVIDQGKAALVERLGSYRRTLEPGVNFVVPILDRVTYEQSVLEQVSEIRPQLCTTADNVTLNVGGTVYWQIVDLEKAMYTVDNVKLALIDTVGADIRAEIGKRGWNDVIKSQTQITDDVLEEVRGETLNWGIKLARIELGNIIIPEEVVKAMERQMAAEIQKQKIISESEGEKQAAINKATAITEMERIKAEAEEKIRLAQAEAYAKAIERVAEVMSKHEHSQEAMQFLLAQNYIEMGKAIGQSPSTKVLFMDPNSVPGKIQSMLSMVEQSMGKNLNDIYAPEDSKQPFGASGNIVPLPRIDRTVQADGEVTGSNN